MKTGNTVASQLANDGWNVPQWSPVMKTGNTGRLPRQQHRRLVASMEPGHEDREYVASGHGVPAALSGLNGARS